MHEPVNILALIDGSSYSVSVCDHTVWIAGNAKSNIEIVHILGRRLTSSEPANLSGSIGLGARSALLEELSEHDAVAARLAQKRGRAILDDAKERIQSRYQTSYQTSYQGSNPPDVTTRMRSGELIDSIHRLEQDADLIVIGKRGEAANFESTHPGSNLERVVRAVHKPVLVASRAFTTIDQCLIAFDGGKSAQKSLDILCSRRWLPVKNCTLLYVGKPSPALQNQLNEASERLEKAGYSVGIRVETGQPEQVITHIVEKDSIDLLVIGAYGHTRIRDLIIGSTTTQMIGSCKIPLLLIR